MFVLLSLREQDRPVGGHVHPPSPSCREIVDGLHAAEHVMLIDLADRRFADLRRLMLQMLDRLAAPDGTVIEGHAVEALPAEPVSPSGRVSELTPRERQVLRLSAEGRSYESIGDALQISVNTVRYHMKRLHIKLNVRNRVAAIHRARALGIV